MITSGFLNSDVDVEDDGRVEEGREDDTGGGIGVSRLERGSPLSVSSSSSLISVCITSYD